MKETRHPGCIPARSLRVVIVSVLVIAVGLGCSWDPEGRTNPLDPLNSDTGYDAIRLSLSIVEVAEGSNVTTKVQLDWWDIDHSALDEYHVFRRAANELAESYRVIAVTQPRESSYIDLGSDTHERYYYQVTATFNGGTDSLISESVLSTRVSY